LCLQEIGLGLVGCGHVGEFEAHFLRVNLQGLRIDLAHDSVRLSGCCQELLKALFERQRVDLIDQLRVYMSSLRVQRLLQLHAIGNLFDEVLHGQRVAIVEQGEDLAHRERIKHLCHDQEYAELISVAETAQLRQQDVLKVRPAWDRHVETAHFVVKPDCLSVFKRDRKFKFTLSEDERAGFAVRGSIGHVDWP